MSRIQGKTFNDTHQVNAGFEVSKASMNQMDLFATEPAAPAYRPDPEKVRSRLRRILAEARAAQAMPWEPARLSLYRTIVPDMTRYLPDDEAAGWRAEFAEQLERFGVAGAA